MAININQPLLLQPCHLPYLLLQYLELLVVSLAQLLLGVVQPIHGLLLRMLGPTKQEMWWVKIPPHFRLGLWWWERKVWSSQMVKRCLLRRCRRQMWHVSSFKIFASCRWLSMHKVYVAGSSTCVLVWWLTPLLKVGGFNWLDLRQQSMFSRGSVTRTSPQLRSMITGFAPPRFLLAIDLSMSMSALAVSWNHWWPLINWTLERFKEWNFWLGECRWSEKLIVFHQHPLIIVLLIISWVGSTSELLRLMQILRLMSPQSWRMRLQSLKNRGKLVRSKNNAARAHRRRVGMAVRTSERTPGVTGLGHLPCRLFSFWDGHVQWLRWTQFGCGD